MIEAIGVSSITLCGTYVGTQWLYWHQFFEVHMSNFDISACTNFFSDFRCQLFRCAYTHFCNPILSATMGIISSGISTRILHLHNDICIGYLKEMQYSDTLGNLTSIRKRRLIRGILPSDLNSGFFNLRYLCPGDS